MEIDQADVVVIGGGVIGLASAYFIARRGKDVVVLDKGIPGWEASGRNGGWASGSPMEEARVPLVKESIRIWQTLDEELDAPTEFVLGGSLSIALTEEDLLLQEEMLENRRRWGIESKRLDLKEMEELLPGVSDRALSGIFNPISGQANPQLTSQAWVWAIQRNGGRIYENTTVTGIGVRDDRVTHVETTAGTIRAEKIVNATGPWANLIAGMVSQYLPVVAMKIQMLCTLPAPPVATCTWAGNGLYCRQAARGHLHFGAGRGQRMSLQNSIEKPTSAAITRGTAKRFVELVPGFADVPVLRTWAGIMDWTPDHMPIIDKFDHPEGMYVNVGFTGIGFSQHPGAGKAMSELVVDGECSFDISGLSLKRFTGIKEFNPLTTAE
ncbi:MAG: FAD-binding oxidoreductase [Candidatus Tectomicrobia bacterium]|nr:FAD-binding oxidoreductase [Candidatus Tectomicrobia bacterium]